MSPKEIMSSGKYNHNVSLLLGTNKDEGLLHTADTYKNPEIVTKWRSKWMDTFGPSTLLGLKDQPIDKHSQDITKKIAEHYVGSVEALTFENIQNITNMYTDSWFAHPVHDFVSRLVSNKQKINYQNTTFQYRFTHQGQFSLTMFIGQGGPYGVDHADEMTYMFSPYIKQPIKLNDNDKKMSEILLSLWKNFAKTGNPSTDKVIWDPIVDLPSRQYLNLNLNPVMEYPDEIKRNMEFWDKIVAEVDGMNEQKKSNCQRNFPQNILWILTIMYLLSM